MKLHVRFLTTVLAMFAVTLGLAASAGTWTGEWADKRFHNGAAVFQLSVEQSGNAISVVFSAVHNDGQGAAPEADGKGSVTKSGVVEFTWQDSFQNSGTGTIKRVGNDVLISLKTTRVADSRCLAFYGQNIRLKPAGKK
jgi:hypothetical protein